MNSLRTLLVAAFTDEPLAGNAAGVVPDATDLSVAQMQAVARELSVSETAFLLPSEQADRRVRYFTPTTEVDLCGHATIASHVFLRDEGEIDEGIHTLETNVGVLDIELDGETVWMTQDSPKIRTVELDSERVAEALGLDSTVISDVGLPLARSSTGLPFLVVPVTFLSVLGDCEPDFPAVEECCEIVDAVGMYVFTFDTLDHDATAHGRMFAPLAGVPEDPVTGTASGAVGTYLREFEAVDEGEMVFEQGHFLDCPGRVRVHVENEVRVGGRATIALDGTLTIPDIEDTEIIEA